MSIDHPKDIRKCIKEISRLAEILQAKVRDFAATNSQKKKDNIDRELSSLVAQLTNIRRELDAEKHGKILLSLGKPDSIARFYAFSLVSLEELKLDFISENRFFGSGIYAIYYRSSKVSSYSAIAESETPIYVGKAIPENHDADTTEQQGTALWKRLREHANSISKSELDTNDFAVRYATVQSGMESAVEDFMIRLFKPIWNKETNVCFGIGKHGDSASTRKNKRSPWDTMHPGRPWAGATPEDQHSREEIEKKIEVHFSKIRPIKDRETLIRMLALS